jgi:uncharacterized protein YgbK (DUF1537 family)
MIAVIADDLTGAAEIAGLGLRYGLTVEIVTTVDQLSKADLLVVATDTRSMPEQEAVKVMSYITVRLKRLNPEVLFKKVDSVIRGHVIAELNTHLKQLDIPRALLVPANPALGRTIVKGNYYVDGEPIHLTSFANDPEFSLTTSDIRDMLRSKDTEIHIRNIEDTLPTQGIIIGECGYADDLDVWATKADSHTLMAGGSGLFNAILGSHDLKEVKEPGIDRNAFNEPMLFICGSTYNKSKQLVEKLSDAGGPVSYMSQDIISSFDPADKLFNQWADDVVALLNKHQKAVIAIHEDAITKTDVSTGYLRDKKARLVEKVLERVAVKELLIEGGATAAAIIKQLNYIQFTPVQEFSTGVIRMKVDKENELFLTLKPGSYDWPEHIWNF